MLDNCKYNKVKLLHELCSMSWFIDKHGLDDAQNLNDSDCIKILESIKKDIDTHVKKISESMLCKCE